jgi:GxxExxY protein
MKECDPSADRFDCPQMTQMMQIRQDKSGFICVICGQESPRVHRKALTAPGADPCTVRAAWRPPSMQERDPRTHAIIGAAMEVYRRLGAGFLEAVYQEALAIELGHRGIPHRSKVRLPIVYRAKTLDTYYVADFICFESVIVEVKAFSELSPAHHAQVINYLKATGHAIGVLLNFGASRLEYPRLILSAHHTSDPDSTGSADDLGPGGAAL